MRRAARIDSTHGPIVKALRKIGCRVLPLHTVGGGVPDLLVLFRDRLYLVECKSRGGTLTRDQENFAQSWPVIVAFAPQQACEAIVAAGAPVPCGHGVPR